MLKEQTVDSFNTSNDTEAYLATLEKEAEDIIKQTYHQEEDKEEDKKEDKDGEEVKTGNEEKGEDAKPEVPDGKDEEVYVEDIKEDKPETDSDDASDNIEIEKLREQLAKAQKQAKDNKGEFTKRSQDLAEATKRSQYLEQNIFDLKNEIADLKSKLGQGGTSKTEAQIIKSTSDINERLKAIEEIDPDIAKAITPVFQGLVEQVETLKDELKVSTEKSVKTANELLEEAHFKAIDDAHPGWEDIVESEEFKEYIGNLSPRQKRLAVHDLQNGSANDIIEVFSDFKSTQSTNDSISPEDKKKEKVNKASSIANPKFNKSKDTNINPQTFKFTKSEIAAMTPEVFAKKEKEIDDAMARGLIDLAN